MPDFTSALYLGLCHLRDELNPWPQFTTGKPAALEEPAEARALARGLAALLGLEAAVLAPSTLHLAWDLFAVLETLHPITIHMDAESYPIAGWGAERTACRGTPVHRFRHHSPPALRRSLAGARDRRRRPVIVTDGFCPGCGRLAPLRDYLACAQAADGWLVVDDTQALGILGHSPDAALPYGYDGGGSLRHCGLRSPRVLVLGSLAKGFGVPLAVLAGSRDAIAAVEQHSRTRVHCSPPSLPTLRAAAHALTTNRRRGNALRGVLAHRVAHFHRRMGQAGFALRGGWFPSLSLALPADTPAVDLHAALAARGVHVLLQGGHETTRDALPQLGFLLTARHTPTDIDQAVAALHALCRPCLPQTVSPEFQP